MPEDARAYCPGLVLHPVLLCVAGRAGQVLGLCRLCGVCGDPVHAALAGSQPGQILALSRQHHQGDAGVFVASS